LLKFLPIAASQQLRSAHPGSSAAGGMTPAASARSVVAVRLIVGFGKLLPRVELPGPT
jgi:hypothetical protein